METNCKFILITILFTLSFINFCWMKTFNVDKMQLESSSTFPTLEQGHRNCLIVCSRKHRLRLDQSKCYLVSELANRSPLRAGIYIEQMPGSEDGITICPENYVCLCFVSTTW